MDKIAKIIPFQKMPRGRDCFDYLIPVALMSKIAIGQIVKIPFGKRIVNGLVLDFAPPQQSSFELKEIVEITTDNSFSKNQVDYLHWFSLYYYYSLGSTLKLMMPDEPKRKLKKKSEIEITNEFPLQKIKDKNVDQILGSKSKKFLLFPYQREQKEALYLKLLEAVAIGEGQVLLVFPQVDKVNQFFAKLPQKLRAVAAVVTSETSRSKNVEFEMWRKINNSTTKIIIGARSAIFSPFRNLELIIIDEADAEDYKQWDQSPKYQSVTALRKLQAIHGCKLIVSSIAPRVEDAFIASHEKYQQIVLGEKGQGQICLVDMSQSGAEKIQLDNSIIDKINLAIAEHRKCLLIVNKRGAYSYVSCGDCHRVFTCDICVLPLTIGTNDQFVCYRCKKTFSAQYNCPNCHGIKYNKFGYGIEQIKKEIEKQVSGKVQVLGGETIDDTATVYLSSMAEATDEVIGKVSFLDFVYIDSPLYLGDFSANFRLYSTLTGIANKYFQKNRGKSITLQTSFPENCAIANVNNEYSAFYKAEIEIRQTYTYPPFINLIKLSFDHHDEAVAEKEAQDLFAKLKADPAFSQIKITDPYPFYARKVRTRYRYEIGLFLGEMSLEAENRLLAIVPNHWTIDKDPKDLL